MIYIDPINSFFDIESKRHRNITKMVAAIDLEVKGKVKDFSDESDHQFELSDGYFSFSKFKLNERIWAYYYTTFTVQRCFGFRTNVEQVILSKLNVDVHSITDLSLKELSESAVELDIPKLLLAHDNPYISYSLRWPEKYKNDSRAVTYYDENGNDIFRILLRQRYGNLVVYPGLSYSSSFHHLPEKSKNYITDKFDIGDDDPSLIAESLGYQRRPELQELTSAIKVM